MSTAPTPTSSGDAAPQARTVAVRARNLRKTYPAGRSRVTALDGVSVDFYAGQWTAIMGPSGSGKSTLMHCLAGLDTPDSGTVYVGSTAVTGASDGARTKLRRTRIGFVFQSYNLVPVLSVRENIILPGKLAMRRTDATRLRDIAEMLGIADVLARRPDQLSGGQQQRVAIARALLPQPDVVFADEPTGNLDSESGDAVLGLLGAAAREMGHTVVMVTHDAYAAAHTDRVLMFADGAIAAEDPSPTASGIMRTVRELSARRSAQAGGGR